MMSLRDDGEGTCSTQTEHRHIMQTLSIESCGHGHRRSRAHGLVNTSESTCKHKSAFLKNLEGGVHKAVYFHDSYCG